MTSFCLSYPVYSLSLPQSQLVTSLHRENRSERKVSRPVWSICASRFLEVVYDGLSGIDKVMAVFPWLVEFGLVEFGACLTPLQLCSARWVGVQVGHRQWSCLCGVERRSLGSALSGWTWTYLALASQGGRRQAVLLFLGALFILQSLSTKVIAWMVLAGSTGHQSSGQLLASSSLGVCLCCVTLVQLRRFKVLSNRVLERSSVPKTFPFKRRKKKDSSTSVILD